MEENLIPSLDIPRIQQQESPMEENLIKQVPLNEKIPLAKEELPSTLSQEKQPPGRRVVWLFGYLVTMLALFWWYQSSQLLSGSQMRTQEESVVREKKQQGSDVAKGSFSIIPKTMLREMQPANLTTLQTAPSQLSKGKPATAKPTVLLDSSRSDRYTIQVGAFGNQESAQRVVSQLLAKGYSGRMGQPEMAEDRYYFVWSGQFTNRAQASRIQTELKVDGFATYIKKVAGQ